MLWLQLKNAFWHGRGQRNSKSSRSACYTCKAKFVSFMSYFISSIELSNQEGEDRKT